MAWLAWVPDVGLKDETKPWDATLAEASLNASTMSYVYILAHWAFLVERFGLALERFYPNLRFRWGGEGSGGLGGSGVSAAPFTREHLPHSWGPSLIDLVL